MQPRTAALLLLLTAIAGQGVLRWRSARAEGEGVGVTGGRGGRPPAEQRERAATRSGEVGPGEQIDVDRAGAGELVRLPGVGPGLAKRIVAERERGGAFGGVECLDARVKGVGEGFLRKAGEHLRFSAGGCAGAGGGEDEGGGCPGVVDLNRAARRELECLPGIGPARAESILALRSRRGGFQGVEELGEVSGLPPRVVAGLRGRVTVGQVP